MTEHQHTQECIRSSEQASWYVCDYATQMTGAKGTSVSSTPLVMTAVFVQSIAISHSGVIVTAVNGGPDGPPFVQFAMRTSDAQLCHFGKRYRLIVEEYPA